MITLVQQYFSASAGHFPDKPGICCDQDVPPLTDFKIFPLAVVAQAVFISKKKTERKLSVMPLDCSAQVVPPSVVNNIFPEAPTANPFKVFTK